MEIFYLQKFKDYDEGPFLKEERDLIVNLASIISNAADSMEAREVLQESLDPSEMKLEITEYKESGISNRQLLPIPVCLSHILRASAPFSGISFISLSSITMKSLPRE